MEQQTIQHDVYDATSRSKHLNLPKSLENQLGVSDIQRKSVAVEGSRVFSLQNLLTTEECKELVENLESIGFENSDDVKAEYPKQYRNNERIIVINQQLADTLWKRLKDHIVEEDFLNATPYGWATEGIWIPVRLNECFLFNRYTEDAFFKPHYDGMYKNEHDECSIFTMTVYLNDDFEGGKLIFRKSKEESNIILNTFQPQAGTAIVFNHDTYHEGEAVTQGKKYLLRTSVMFQRISDMSDPHKRYRDDPQWQHLRDVFRSFDDLNAEGDPDKFTTTFLKVQALQLAKNRTLHESPSSSLPRDILVNICANYMDSLSDICAFSFVCRAFWQASRSSTVWKTWYQRRWGSTGISLIEREENLFLQDWFGLYRIRHVISKSFAPIILLLNDRVRSFDYARNEYKDWHMDACAEYSGDPWDPSFKTWDAGYGDSFLEPDYVNPEKKTFEVSELGYHVDRVIINAIVKHEYEEKILCEHPLLFITYPFWQGHFMNSEHPENITIDGKGKLVTRTDKAIVDRFNNHCALSLVEAGLCALYSQSKDVGIAVHINLLSRFDSRAVLFFGAYQNSEIVRHFDSILAISMKANSKERDGFIDECVEAFGKFPEDIKRQNNVVEIIWDISNPNAELLERMVGVGNLLATAAEKLGLVLHEASQEEIVRGASVFASLSTFRTSYVKIEHHVAKVLLAQ